MRRGTSGEDESNGEGAGVCGGSGQESAELVAEVDGESFGSVGGPRVEFGRRGGEGKRVGG